MPRSSRSRGPFPPGFWRKGGPAQTGPARKPAILAGKPGRRQHEGPSTGAGPGDRRPSGGRWLWVAQHEAGLLRLRLGGTLKVDIGGTDAQDAQDTQDAQDDAASVLGDPGVL